MAAGQPGNGTTMWTSVGDTHVFRKEPDGHRWGEQIPVIAGLERPVAAASSNGRVVGRPSRTRTGPPCACRCSTTATTATAPPGDGVYAGVYTRTTDVREARQRTTTRRRSRTAPTRCRIRATGTNNVGRRLHPARRTLVRALRERRPQPGRRRRRHAEPLRGLPPVPEGCRTRPTPGHRPRRRRSREPGASGRPAPTRASADTDLGGEPDGSELKRGANPFDATDDALPRPEGAAVIDRAGRPPSAAGLQAAVRC